MQEWQKDLTGSRGCFLPFIFQRFRKVPEEQLRKEGEAYRLNHRKYTSRRARLNARFNYNSPATITTRWIDISFQRKKQFAAI